MALAGEVGELVAEFQWLTPSQSAAIATDDSEAASRVHDELADVAIYLIRLADVLGADLVELANAKLDANEGRYSAEEFRGSARKARSL